MKYVGLYDNNKDIVTKEKLEAVASRVSTNEDNIAMAKSDIDGLQTDVGTLKTAVGNVQTSLASKQDTVVGGASTITEDNLTASRALVSNSSGKVAVSTVTSTELGYLDGVTSNVQTQLDKKLETAPVTSVNSKTGAVQLNASDVGALPADTFIPTVNNATLTIKRNSIDVGSFTANAANDVNIDINVPTGKADIGLSNVDNVKQYSATNPPPYPVTSVNGKTGAVTVREVPAVTTADNGKFLSVVSGAWAAAEAASITPHIDETTKHWMIGNTDTGIVAEGKTSYIGDNGNWYEWDATSGTFVDSGVSAHPFPYVQPDEPIDAPEFSIWVDTDEEALYIARAEGVGF